MNRKEAIKTDEVHARIFQTYKDLQKMIPKNILQTRVFRSQKYPVKIQPLLTHIEQEKQKDLKEFLPQNLNIKKKILFSPPKNIFIITNDTYPLRNDSKTLENKETPLTQFNRLNNNSKRFRNQYFLSCNNSHSKSHHKYLYSFKENNNNSINENNSQSNLSKSFNNEDPSEKENEKKEIIQQENLHDGYKIKKIKDSNLKHNIYLPSIIDRLKLSEPRGERQKKGLIIKGQNENSFKLIQRNLLKMGLQKKEYNNKNITKDLSYDYLYNQARESHYKKTLDPSYDIKTISTNSLFSNEFFENIKIVRFNKKIKKKIINS